MTVLALHKSKPADDVSAALRRIADQIDAGEFAFPVTTAVLVIGHSDSEVPLSAGVLMEESFWHTFALGVRCGTFTVRGLVNSAMRKWNYDDD